MNTRTADRATPAPQGAGKKKTIRAWAIWLVWLGLSVLALYECWEYTHRVPQTAHTQAEMEQRARKARDQIAFFAGGGLSREEDAQIIADLSRSLRTGEFTTELVGIPYNGEKNSPAHNWLGRLRVIAGVRGLKELDKKIVDLHGVLAKEKRFATTKEIQEAEQWLDTIHASLDEFRALRGEFSFKLQPMPFDSRSVHVGLGDNDLVSAENAEEYFRAIIMGRMPYSRWSAGP